MKVRNKKKRRREMMDVFRKQDNGKGKLGNGNTREDSKRKVDRETKRNKINLPFTDSWEQGNEGRRKTRRETLTVLIQYIGSSIEHTITEGVESDSG